MKQVRVRVTCDPCQAWHQAEVEEGVETVPVAGSGQTLDLCPGHRSDLAPFLALVAEWGATAGKQPRKSSSNGHSAPVVAQAPEQARKGSKQRGGARARKRRQGASQQPTAAPSSSALACPLCQVELGSSASLGAHLRQNHGTNIGQVYGTQCPLCGQDGTTRHLSAVHGFTGGMPVAFHQAQAQGDPHGVIAARAEAVAKLSSASPS